MALTDFGKAVRKARVDLEVTLESMAKALGTSMSFLSGMETGRKKISKDWVLKIDAYLRSHGKAVDQLPELAAVANESVPVEGLPFQQQILIAQFAKSQFTPDELRKIAELWDEMERSKKENDVVSE